MIHFIFFTGHWVRYFVKSFCVGLFQVSNNVFWICQMVILVVSIRSYKESIIGNCFYGNEKFLHELEISLKLLIIISILFDQNLTDSVKPASKNQKLDFLLGWLIMIVWIEYSTNLCSFHNYETLGGNLPHSWVFKEGSVVIKMMQYLLLNLKQSGPPLWFFKKCIF